MTGEASCRAKAKVINELVLTLACLPVLQLEIAKNPQNVKKKKEKERTITGQHLVSPTKIFL